MGAHLGLHLKNERKTKFRQLRVKKTFLSYYFIKLIGGFRLLFSTVKLTSKKKNEKKNQAVEGN